MAGHRGKQMADAVSKSWEDGLEAFDQPLQGVVDATDDLGRALGKTGDQGKDAFGKIGQSAKGASQTVSGMSGILSNAFARVLTAVGAVTGAFALARSAGQAFWDWFEKSDRAMAEREQKRQAAREALTREVNANYRANMDAIEEAGVADSLRNESQAVDDINKKYQDRLKTLEAMSRMRTSDLQNEQRILNSRKEQEASMIRQKMLTGAMSAAQGRQALASLDASYAARAREMEAREDRAKVAEARQKLAAAEAHKAELDTYQRSAEQSPYKLVGGQDFRALWQDASAVWQGTPENKELSGRIYDLSKNINSLKDAWANAKTPEERKRLEGLIAEQEKLKAPFDEKYARGVRAEEIIKSIVAGMKADGIYPEGMQEGSISWVNAISSRLDRYMDIYKALPEKITEAMKDVASKRQDVTEAERTAAQHGIAREQEASTGKSLQAEKNLEAQKDAFAKSLAELSEAIKRISETYLGNSRNLRTSDDPKLRAALHPDQPAGKALDRADRVAQGTYMTPGDAVAIRQALAEVKRSRMDDNSKSSIVNLLEPYLRTMESMQSRARQRMTGAEIKEDARLNFTSRRDMLIGTDAYRRNPSDLIRQATKELDKAFADKKLDAAEAAKLLAKAEQLKKSTSHAANKEYGDILESFVRDFADGQSRAIKQAKQINKQGSSKELERQVAEQLRDAARDNYIDPSEVSRLSGIAETLSRQPELSESLKKLLALVQKVLDEQSKQAGINEDTAREIEALDKSLHPEIGKAQRQADRIRTAKINRAQQAAASTTVTEITQPDTTPVNNAVQAVAQGNQVVQSFNQMIMEGMQQLIDVASQGAANTASAMQQLEGMRLSINNLQQQVSQASQRATIQGGRGI